MSRPLRIQYKGAFYHIISRGNQGDSIFKKATDKRYLIATLSKACDRYDLIIYVYCIMGNHYHLLMETKKANLSSSMHFIGSTFASYMSRNGVIGHIFSGRYKSILVEKEEYLVALSRYIHLNPVKAGLVERPQDYRWSSCKYYCNATTAPHWLNNTWIIGEFGNTLESAKKAYMGLVMASIDESYEYPVEKIRANSVMGSRNFFIKAANEIPDEQKLEQVTGKEQIIKGMEIENIHRATCEFFEIDALYSVKGSENDHLLYPRNMFIYLAKKYTVATNKEICDYVRNLKPSSVSCQYSRISKCFEIDKNASRLWEDDSKSILQIAKP